MPVRAFCVVGLVALTLANPRAQEQPPVNQLMERVGEYVQRFIAAFSNVVAEERYEPEPARRGRQRLRSDYLLVRSPRNEQNFMTFRDVVEVNGKPVQNQQERLAKLFLKPSEDSVAQANAIAAHSERYIPPTTDPLLALVFLQREYQTRFLYTLGERDPAYGPDVQRINFVETGSPTLLRRTDDSDLPARGTVWVSEATGHVFRTQLQFGSDENALTVTTVFGFDEALRIEVPLEMHESFRASGRLVQGLAKYSRFRRFGVRTNEDIDTPAPER